MDSLVVGGKQHSSLISGSILFWEDYAYICGLGAFSCNIGPVTKPDCELPQIDKKNLWSDAAFA